jgi:hypothetical protein
MKSSVQNKKLKIWDRLNRVKESIKQIRARSKEMMQNLERRIQRWSWMSPRGPGSKG